jgi:hypothetical protein
MKETIDTSRVVVIPASTFGSRCQLFFSALGILAIGGFFGWIFVEMWLQPAPPPGVQVSYAPRGFEEWTVVGLLISFVLICVAGLVSARQFLKISGDIVTVAPDGIRDRRATEDFVPWQAVRSVSLAEGQPNYYIRRGSIGVPVYAGLEVVLNLDPALTDRTAIAQAVLLRTIHYTLPWMTFRINTVSLKKTNAIQFYELCQAYWAAHGKVANRPA